MSVCEHQSNVESTRSSPQTPKLNGNVPLHSTLLFFPKQQLHKAPTACKKRAKALGLLCFPNGKTWNALENTCYFLHLGPVRRRKAKRTTATSIAEFHHCTAKSVAAKNSVVVPRQVCGVNSRAHSHFLLPLEYPYTFLKHAWA